MWLSVLTSASQKSDPDARCARPDTGHSGTFKSNKCDYPILLTIKQILFTEAYQKLIADD